jgi:hypothetical protein
MAALARCAHIILAVQPFCQAVKIGRAKLKGQATKASVVAARRNMRKVVINTNPRQFGLEF